MTTRLVLLCHGTTRSMRKGGFAAADEPLDAEGLRKLAATRLDLGKFDQVVASPAKAAQQTCAELGLTASIDERLRDMDFGRWSGLTFDELHTRDADGFAAWLAKPDKGAPGGESLQDVCGRLQGWLGEREAEAGALLAVTHPMIVRAVLANTLGLPDTSVMRFDVAPLSITVFSYHRGWRLQAMGR